MTRKENIEVDILATQICEPFIIKLRSDGIVHSHTTGDEKLTIESLQRFGVVMSEMINHKQAPLLLTLDEFVIPAVEVRAFWAKKESCLCVSAEAYYVTNIGHRIIGNFYLKFNKPGRPTRIFTNKEEAIAWLKGFL